jgi:hypothetical protein
MNALVVEVCPIRWRGVDSNHQYRVTRLRFREGVISDNGALAVGILLSAHFRVGGCKYRTREHRRVASRAAARRRSHRRCQTERTFEPRQFFLGSAARTDIPAVGIIIRIAGIDLEGARSSCPSASA